jgi:hypothetical protein
VDLLARYSNHDEQLGSLLELLERMAAGDQTNLPGLEVVGDDAPAALPAGSASGYPRAPSRRWWSAFGRA